jgi:SH3-like domain-containing protein
MQILEEMRQWRRVSTTDSESGTSSKGLTAGAPHLKVRATTSATANLYC